VTPAGPLVRRPAGAFRMCSINRGPGCVYPINTLKRIKK
jgi:hypothetical protein